MIGIIVSLKLHLSLGVDSLNCSTDAFTENFGPIGILDHIYGSNRVFKAWLGELRLRDCGRDPRVALAAMEKEKELKHRKKETFELRPEYECI